MDRVELRPIGMAELESLSTLFARNRATRHCWCTAFCSSGKQFALGWYGGGNRRRFASMAAASAAPMGVLALVDGAPVGWCACGPRARYLSAIRGRSSPLATLPRAEDDGVWLVACLFVDSSHRGMPVVLPLLRAAVSRAAADGAPAIEAWPLARGVRDPGLAHVGREGVFAGLGFRCVAWPTPQRVIMRRELGAA